MITCEDALIAGPAEEPLSLDEAKKHASIVQDDDNAMVRGYIQAAREAAESVLHHALYTQTRKAGLSDWADVIWLPMAKPLQNNPNATPSTAPVVEYYDAAGTLQTLATSYYLVDTLSQPGRILRAPNQAWPSLQPDRLGARVFITYVCGWPSVAAIPELIKQGLRLHVAYSDADRIGSADAEHSRKAAENCWRLAGPVYWRPPTCLS